MTDLHGSEPILDVEHLVAQTFSDRGLEQELLALFADQCARLSPVLGSGTEQERSQAAHALRGAALAIGASRLAAVMAMLEDGAMLAPSALDRTIRETLSAITDRRDVS